MLSMPINSGPGNPGGNLYRLAAGALAPATGDIPEWYSWLSLSIAVRLRSYNDSSGCVRPHNGSLAFGVAGSLMAA